MATTRNIMASTLYALPFLGYQPVNISYNEPALQAANIVKQTMLGAPFAWPWNRAEQQVQLSTADGQDYIYLPDAAVPYGFLERAWLIDSAGRKTEIRIVLNLAEESAKQRPASLAVQRLDSDERVTIRINTIPDQDYTLRFSYQIAPKLMTSLASSWAPIPDSLSYIYEWGFIAIVAMLTKDVRVPLFGQRFVSHLLGAQDGLTQTERNIFLGNWLDLITEPQRAAQAAQMAGQMRSTG